MSERRKERKTDGTDWELVQMDWDAEENPEPAVPTVEQVAENMRRRIAWDDEVRDMRGNPTDDKGSDPYHANLRATRLDQGK